MSQPANLLATHPLGDPVVIPCTHLVPQHTNGDTFTTPCTHIVRKHQDDDEIEVPFAGKKKIPCFHLEIRDPQGDPVTIPCVHLVPMHAQGDEGQSLPCIHPLAPVSTDEARHLVFFTGNTTYVSLATRWVDLLTGALGVRSVGAGTRPLLFFFRDPVKGDPTDATDPFWSHYNPVFHSIQVIHHPQNAYSTATSEGSLALTEHLPHELGHAIVGQSCVQVSHPEVLARPVHEGGLPRMINHELKVPSNPGTALSEGWADFVRVVLQRDGQRTRPANQEEFETRDPAVPKTKDIEYNIMCVLWDLYDLPATPARSGPGAANRASDDDEAINAATGFTFPELLGVFSPNGDTLPSGPFLVDIDDYLNRLKASFPNRRDVIDRIRAQHLN